MKFVLKNICLVERFAEGEWKQRRQGGGGCVGKKVETDRKNTKNRRTVMMRSKKRDNPVDKESHVSYCRYCAAVR